MSERGPLGLLCGIQTNLNTKEFPYNTWKLTNVSIWRNQATNRPLSPDDIPDVRPWQPGLREAQRFCLTAVSPSLVLLRAGLTASYGGTPMDCVWVKRGKVGWANIKTQCSPDKDSKMVILQKHQNKVTNLINEPGFLFTLSQRRQLKDIFTGQCHGTKREYIIL